MLGASVLGLPVLGVVVFMVPPVVAASFVVSWLYRDRPWVDEDEEPTGSEPFQAAVEA